MERRRTLRTAIDQGLERLLVVRVHHVHERGIDPPSRGYGVETGNDEVELHVKVLIVILDLVVVAWVSLWLCYACMRM